MDHLKITAAIHDMRRDIFLTLVLILVLLYAGTVFLAIPPAEVYTLKSQLCFAVISFVFWFSLGFIFGARFDL